MSKFEIGDGYKTRDGRDAGIYWIGPELMHGWVQSRSQGIGRTSATWFLTGRIDGACTRSSDVMPKEVPLLECNVVVNSDSHIVCFSAGPNHDPTWGDQYRIVRMREVRE